MRAIWSGSISFGLVNIPIKLFSAVSEERFDFDLLHKRDLSNIRYAKVCKIEGEEVGKDEIVKGYQYEKNQYVIIEDEDFYKANVKKSSSIDISEFTDEEKIDTIFYEKSYYLKPEKSASKSFNLLKEALKKTGKVAVGTFVLRNREHLVLLKPYKEIILLTRLRFLSDIKDPSELQEKTEVIPEKELQLAISLIEQLESSFSPEKYKDTYSEDLKAIIEEKISGRIPSIKGTVPEPTNVKDLMASLKKSLEYEKQKSRK